MPQQIIKWDRRFMRIAALEVSRWSKDPSTKCGCVIVDKDRHIVATGYNGFPQGVDDRPADYNTRGIKYERIIHAEVNAILRGLKKGSLEDCTLYVWPFQPCARCAAIIAQVGIKRVVTCVTPEEIAERWEQSIYLANLTFSEAAITLKEYRPSFIEEPED